MVHGAWVQSLLTLATSRWDYEIHWTSAQNKRWCQIEDIPDRDRGSYIKSMNFKIIPLFFNFELHSGPWFDSLQCQVCFTCRSGQRSTWTWSWTRLNNSIMVNPTMQQSWRQRLIEPSALRGDASCTLLTGWLNEHVILWLVIVMPYNNIIVSLLIH